jgi:hypothetical protein
MLEYLADHRSSDGHKLGRITRPGRLFRGPVDGLLLQRRRRRK